MQRDYRHRVLDIASSVSQRSVFLFGPRQIGESSYVQEQLESHPVLSYNLLDGGLRLRLLDPTLIRQEVEARNLPAFARFLQTAATVNAKIINYTNIANDAQVLRQTVCLWFQILIDTMLGYELLPYTSTLKRKAIKTAKFYFFDIGVVRILRRLPPIVPEGADFGEFFEHYIFMELKAYLDYRKPSSRLSYWRSLSGYEVDFVIDDEVAIEVKAAAIAQDKHLSGLKALREERKIRSFYLVCRESRPRKLDGIDILPWREFLARLWEGDILVGG